MKIAIAKSTTVSFNDASGRSSDSNEFADFTAVRGRRSPGDKYGSFDTTLLAMRYL
jgi:hypothetical protein